MTIVCIILKLSQRLNDNTAKTNHLWGLIKVYWASILGFGDVTIPRFWGGWYQLVVGSREILILMKTRSKVVTFEKKIEQFGLQYKKCSCKCLEKGRKFGWMK